MTGGDTCPVPGCDLPYSARLQDFGAFAVRPDTLKAAKLCVLPVHDGERPGFLHVYHSFTDIADAGPEAVAAVAHDDVAAAADGSGYETPGDISADHATVYGLVEGHENEHGGTSILLANLRPAAVEAGIEREKVESIALNLVFHGFIEEVENAVFKAPERAPEVAA